MSSGKEAQPPKIVYQEDFPETTFIAVTAYQNEEVHLMPAEGNKVYLISSLHRLPN